MIIANHLSPLKKYLFYFQRTIIPKLNFNISEVHASFKTNHYDFYLPMIQIKLLMGCEKSLHIILYIFCLQCVYQHF